MTAGRDPAPSQAVGFFGKLGAGNYGNDGSLEALLTHVRQHHQLRQRRLGDRQAWNQATQRR